MLRSPDAAFLHALADAADAQTLPRFRRRGAIDNKLVDDFDPVTEADRQSEQAIRQAIEAAFPEHAILGEEYGSSGEGPSLWVIDPIDGTRAFVSGLPVWGTLIGYCEEGQARLGIMSQPFTGERFLADGAASWLVRGGTRERLATSGLEDLSQATLFTTSPRLFTGAARDGFERLEQTARLTRFGVDCYAFAMLAAGHADVVVECGLKPYDIVALIPIVEQAGGVVTTAEGARAEGGGTIVASASAKLHAAVLALYAG